MEMKSVALVYRSHSKQAVKMAKEVTLWFQKKKIKVYTAPGQKILPRTQFATSPKRGLSMVLVLGGDGTYLRAVRFLDGAQVPTLGFNMGSLGFLTTSTPNLLYELLEKILNSEMEIQKRMLLEVRVLRRKKIRNQSVALNDVVIERGSYSQLINTSIFSSRKFVSEIKADALIIASPTGSTAYNLAAGGPLLDPELKALILTPVAPHSLTSRPLIFPPERKLSFKLQDPQQMAKLIVDGQEKIDLTIDDEVIVNKCADAHLMLQSAQYNFFHLLREKLKFGDRA